MKKKKKTIIVPRYSLIFIGTKQEWEKWINGSNSELCNVSLKLNGGSFVKKKMVFCEEKSMLFLPSDAAVSKRCDYLIANGKNPVFCGLPVAARENCKAFEENLDLINPRLKELIERMLWNHFFEHESTVDCAPLVEKIVQENPCGISRPETKYPFMFKSFLYAAYCGLTASKLWNGSSQVNGGFIKVGSNGEVLAYYALESDSFKTYLYNNCYLEFPSTDEKHGNYARVYCEDGEYYFRLNFQIRYR